MSSPTRRDSKRLNAIGSSSSANSVEPAPETLGALAPEADETVCVEAAKGLGAIGNYYDDFHQMADEEVTDLLTRAARSATSP